jgi:hypothetical protein
MGVIDVLRKLGILRFGAKATTYTSGKDRPVEFMMEGVYDAEKDMIRRKDAADTGKPISGQSGKVK